MTPELAALRHVVAHPWRFALQALRAFRAHQGLLLAGAVAYYTLLSIIPLFSLLLVGLSHFVDEGELITMTHELLELLVANEADAVTDQIETFLQHRAIVSGFGLLVMLFFSSLSFSVLETSMAVIFFHRAATRRRHFLVSATLPFLFIGLLGLGVLGVTVVGTMLQTIDLSLSETASLLLYLLGVAGLMLMLTAIYLVIPVGRVSFRHALIGGVTAGLLWEIARHLMVWYFRTLSMVNVIYGSFATSVVALLSLEVAALILLFGAQVIAEFERLIVAAAGDEPPPTGP